MKSIIYGSCIIFYLTGLFLIMKFLYDIQNVTFNNTYQSVLFPFVGLFFIGFYFSLAKLFKKVIESTINIRFRITTKLLYLTIGIIILLLFVIRFSFNPLNLFVFFVFIGYGIAFISGYQVIKIEK